MAAANIAAVGIRLSHFGFRNNIEMSIWSSS
jgi:hypothetical protein